MNLLDWIIIIYIAGSVLNGLKQGLVRMAGSIVGLVIGVVLAGQWYEVLGSWLSAFVFSNPMVADVVAFFLIVSLVTRAVGIVAAILDNVVKFVSIIPGIAAVNKLAGGALGLLEGVLIVGVTLYFAQKFDVGPAWRDTLVNSALVPFLTGVSQVVVPLLPGAVKSVQSILKDRIVL